MTDPGNSSRGPSGGGEDNGTIEEPSDICLTSFGPPPICNEGPPSAPTDEPTTGCDNEVENCAEDSDAAQDGDDGLPEYVPPSDEEEEESSGNDDNEEEDTSFEGGDSQFD